MRLLDTCRAAVPGRAPRSQSNPVLRAAVLSACLVFLCGALLLSPLFRVTTVVWTGSVVLDGPRCTGMERASLGHSLLLLPERLLRAHVDDSERLTVQFIKHFPNTLEVSVISRLAVAMDDRGVVFDAQGWTVPPRHSDPGLPRLRGFSTHNGRLEPAGVRVLDALEQLRTFPALRVERVERNDEDVAFHLARSRTRVRMRLAALDLQLHKLRLYEESLGAAEMPAVVDLRFRQQVVVRGEAGGAHEDG